MRETRGPVETTARGARMRATSGEIILWHEFTHRPHVFSIPLPFSVRLANGAFCIPPTGSRRASGLGIQWRRRPAMQQTRRVSQVLSVEHSILFAWEANFKQHRLILFCRVFYYA